LDQVQESERTLTKTDEMIQKLSEFGLTADEASIFFLLTRIKKSSVEWISGKDLAKIAKRDRVRVYQIVLKLEKMGLIRANFGRPIGYSAISPESAMEKLVSMHEAKLVQLNSYQSELKEALRTAEPIEVMAYSRSDQQNNPAMTMVHGVSGIQHLIRNSLVDNAIRIIANADSVDYIVSTILRSPQKPKSCKILLSGADDPVSLQAGLDSRELDLQWARIERHLPTFILTENQVLILFYSVEKYRPRALSSMKSRLVMLHALVVGDKIYVEEMQDLFQTLWDVSKRYHNSPLSIETAAE